MKTIILRLKSTTLNGLDIPDFGETYSPAVQVTIPGKYYFLQISNDIAAALERLDVSFPGPPQQNLYIGTVSSAAALTFIKGIVGAAAFSGVEALINGPVAAALSTAGIKRVRRKSDLTEVGLVATNAISGHNPFLAALPDDADPVDFEIV